jgi:hypothetical protein
MHNTNMKKIRSRNAIRRTRTGCQTCRKRRKGCDEARPACNTCKRLNLECTYDMPLRWATTRTLFVEQNERSLLQRSVYDFATPSPDPSSDAQLRQVLQRIGAPQNLQRTVFLTLCNKDREILLECGCRSLPWRNSFQSRMWTTTRMIDLSNGKPRVAKHNRRSITPRLLGAPLNQVVDVAGFLCSIE